MADWDVRSTEETAGEAAPRLPHESDGPVDHSVTGIISFIMGAVVVLGYLASIILLFIVAALPSSRAGGGPPPFLVGLTLMMSFGFCFAIILCVVGLILGIVGVNDRRCRRVFAWLGLSINGVIVFGCVALVGLGMLSALLK